MVKLVPAEAGHGVAGPDDLLEALAQGDQQPVAGVVAERVVDELEPVQVQEQHRHRGGCAWVLARARAILSRKNTRLGEAGEGVVGGLMGNWAWAWLRSRAMSARWAASSSRPSSPEPGQQGSSK